MQKKSFYSIGSLLLLLALFIGFSMLSTNFLRGLRFDLTENGLYTLSEGTSNILANLQEPVTLYLFFSGALFRTGGSGDRVRIAGRASGGYRRHPLSRHCGQ